MALNKITCILNDQCSYNNFVGLSYQWWDSGDKMSDSMT